MSPLTDTDKHMEMFPPLLLDQENLENTRTIMCKMYFSSFWMTTNPFFKKRFLNKIERGGEREHEQGEGQTEKEVQTPRWAGSPLDSA